MLTLVKPDPWVGEDILTVSHSQLGTRDRCSFAWHIGYELGYTPKEKKKALELGSMLHALADIWYTSHDATLVDQQIHRWLDGNLDGFVLENIAAATWVFKKYIEYAQVMDNWKVLSTENHFVIPLTTPEGRRYNLQGYTDLIVEIEGRIWLLDHKSSTKFWTPTQVLMDSQMPLYAAALRTLGVDVFGIIINMMNTYQYKDKSKVKMEQLFKRERTYRTPQELDAVLENTGMLVDEIYNKAPIRRSLRKDCDRCNFQEPCLLALKGVDIESVLSATCRKKDSFQDPDPVGVTEISLDELF